MIWLWSGLFLVAAGGAMQGSFALPQKFIRGWAWEKTWLIYSIFGMIVFPWLVVGASIPQATEVYANVSGDVLARTALFGFGWGVGSVLFGLGIARVGMALGFAIIVSVAASVGSLVPLAVLHPDEVISRRGGLLILGLALITLGLIFFGRAGSRKEASGGQLPASNAHRGIAICIASGILSSLMNFSFVFGQPIATEAVQRGADPGSASIAIFAVAVTAGFVANAGYCLYLLLRNESWARRHGQPRLRNTSCALAMGLLWLFGYFFYGHGITKLGEFGTALGWPLFMILMVLVANVWGLVTGEWRAADRLAFRYRCYGMGVVLAALVVVAAGT
jgi:L-rhamnose-H+ transport protein